MSKTLFTFLLSELKTARLICQHCGAVAEMPIEKLGQLHARTTLCPACNMAFPRADPVTGKDDYLLLLAQAFAGLKSVNQEIEFVVGAPSGKS